MRILNDGPISFCFLTNGEMNKKISNEGYQVTNSALKIFSFMSSLASNLGVQIKASPIAAIGIVATIAGLAITLFYLYSNKPFKTPLNHEPPQHLQLTDKGFQFVSRSKLVSGSKELPFELSVDLNTSILENLSISDLLSCSGVCKDLRSEAQKELYKEKRWPQWEKRLQFDYSRFEVDSIISPDDSLPQLKTRDTIIALMSFRISTKSFDYHGPLTILDFPDGITRAMAFEKVMPGNNRRNIIINDAFRKSYKDGSCITQTAKRVIVTRQLIDYNKKIQINSGCRLLTVTEVCALQQHLTKDGEDVPVVLTSDTVQRIEVGGMLHQTQLLAGTRWAFKSSPQDLTIGNSTTIIVFDNDWYQYMNHHPTRIMAAKTIAG